MSDRDALLAAIIAHPDDDTPRLMYADWLDEHAPDATPSPAAGPSARAEYIRVQCRLAQHPFDYPDYPELLEREQDLADWLKAHTPEKESRPNVPEAFDWFGSFDSIADDGSEHAAYRRGFPWVVEYGEWDDEPDDNIATITKNLPAVFARSTVRALDLEDAYGSEIAGIMAHPCVSGLRGFYLGDVDYNDEADALGVIATSEHLTGLRHLRLDTSVDTGSLKKLAKATHLNTLESFAFDFPSTAELKVLGAARWFRNLRSLRLWMDDRDALKVLAELPPMPNLVALSFRGSTAPTATAMRRFAASDSFPQLARLEFESVRLGPDLVALLAAGTWPLRHLRFDSVPVKKGGAEALAGAAFAPTLRVLELIHCEITAGGVAALANSEALAGLRHLHLPTNPIGAGGLLALVRSKHLRELRSLHLSNCNMTNAPLDAATLLNFLAALELPELRHLKLDRLPVCIRGARALAANGTFANLTRLGLSECGLREAGARAVVESGAFPNLTWVNLSENAAGKGVSKLADPRTFPRLGYADVSRNRVPKSPLWRLAKRPGVEV